MQCPSFPEKFKVLVKSNMAAILDDINTYLLTYLHQYLPHLVDLITGYILKVKKIPTKTQGRGCSNPPPPRFVPRRGYKFACTSEG